MNTHQQSPLRRGLEQAQAELRQVSLIARYRLSEALLWMDSLRREDAARSQSALAIGLVALKWFLPVAVFSWWRRRADTLFSEWRKSAREERRRNRVAGSGLARDAIERGGQRKAPGAGAAPPSDPQHLGGRRLGARSSFK